MNQLRDAALAYAERGWRVFPLHGIRDGRCTCARADCSSPGKHPLVRRGVHEATTHEDVVRDWWRRWRSANIGLATGSTSGIVVIDIDLPAAFESLDRLVHKLPATLTALTGGGGAHLIYRGVADVGCTTARVPGIEGELPGIDVRGDGGYIVAPPSVHRTGERYEWLDPSRDPEPAPQWLRDPPRVATPITVASAASFDGDGTPYGLAVLRDELDRLRSAKPGQRNHTLNRAAFSIARVVAGGELLESSARASLVRTALEIGLTEHETLLTIESAFRAGLLEPRVAPHRTKQRRMPSSTADA